MAQIPENRGAAAWSPGHVVGGHRVTRLLAWGKSGHLYEAEQAGTGRAVVLKALHRAVEPAVSARLLRAARDAMGVECPHLARVLDAGLDPIGRLFVVTERLTGETLAERLRREGKLAWQVAVELIEQACIGLAALHGRGVVHGDLKPSNLFITTDGAREEVKIIDVCQGPLVSLDDALGREGGPVAFSSPERLQSPTEIEPSSDIWSLGVTLHQSLTGSLPFRGETASETIVAILNGNAARAIQAEPDLPEMLQALIDECLRSSPEIRLSSATALLEGLRAVVKGDPSVERLFRTGRSFRIFLRDRLFVLVWVGSPVADDVDLICKAAIDARAAVSRPLVELVLAPPSMGLGLSELLAGDRMVARFTEFVRAFESLYMVIDADGYAFRMLQRASELIAEGSRVPWSIGRRSDILALVSAREGIPVEEIDRMLRAR